MLISLNLINPFKEILIFFITAFRLDYKSNTSDSTNLNVLGLSNKFNSPYFNKLKSKLIMLQLTASAVLFAIGIAVMTAIVHMINRYNWQAGSAMDSDPPSLRFIFNLFLCFSMAHMLMFSGSHLINIVNIYLGMNLPIVYDHFFHPVEVISVGVKGIILIVENILRG